MKPNETEEFDPGLGLGVADTWWALGRRLAAFQAASTPQEENAYAERWIAEILEDENERFEDQRAALKPDRLREFARTVPELLERKFRGRSIAADAAGLMRACSQYDVREEAQFLDLYEPIDVWWANEYRLLFADLVDRSPYPTWLSAVGTCAREECGQFFIKQRSDQRYHSESCRARVANQRAYKKRKSQPHRRGAKSRSR
jgi:hypothetical protein